MSGRLSLFVLLAAIALAAAQAKAGGFFVEETAESADVARVLVEVPESEEGLLFIGDMAFDPEALRLRGFAGRRWAGGILPVGFHQNVSQRNQDRFFAACAEWTKVAAVRCVPRSVEKNWVQVESGRGNWSMIGRVGGMQRMQIFNWEVKVIIAHEIGHALGLGHEQQRPDRDSYVEILFDAIPQNRWNNFKILPMRTHSGYDFASIMHYPSNAFGIPHPQTGLAMTTIRPRPEFHEFAQFIGQQARLSKGDAIGMSAEYGQPARALPAADEFQTLGDVDRVISGALSSPDAPAGRVMASEANSELATPSIENHPAYRENIRAMADAGIEKVFGGLRVVPPSLSDVVGVAASMSDIVKCTGTLVHPDRVVTARHCVCQGISGRVMVGSSKIDGTWHEVDRVRVVGDACDPLDVRDNPDIAVLHLKTPIEGVEIRPLASQDEIDAARFYTVAGFGFTEELVSGVKHETEVPSATNDCSGRPAGWDTSEATAFGCHAGLEIVAGQAGLGRDSCNGDSGGGLFVLPEGATGEAALRLAGVTSRATKGSSVSLGLSCGDGGIYVRMTPELAQFALSDG